MAQFFTIHPANPQQRLISQAVQIIKKGGVIAYPTDSSYALGCEIANKSAMEKIRRIRRVGSDHNFTLVCEDLAQVSKYARIDNEIYRFLKRFTPGPYTFILSATREVPRRLQSPKRKTIGLRVPDHELVSALLNNLGEPIMSSTLMLPGQSLPMNDAEDIREALERDVDLVIDGGPCDAEATTVVNLESGMPVIDREGKGDIADIFG